MGSEICREQTLKVASGNPVFQDPREDGQALSRLDTHKPLFWALIVSGMC